ncbi:MAG TPA: TonB-dependent receptor [Steroidobacteraceae bacterium]|nr:TonB-dependent receptor [Steroidobacteraceae bacterium]
MRATGYLLVLFGGVLSVATGYAQSPPGTGADASGGGKAAGGDLSEIVVTAQRRAQSLHDVPIAVTAVPPERLEQLNLRDVNQVAVVTPGFVFGSAYGFTQTFIRGVGSSFPQPGLESSVSTYLDGAYVARALGEIFNLLDVQTVQVLKGPQGTLYGRNATGGAIVVNTADPTEVAEGSAKLEYGRFNHVLAEAVGNIPLSDTVAVRIAGRFTREDGFVHNLTTGHDTPDTQSHDVRASLSWRPSSALSGVLKIEDTRLQTDPFPKAQRLAAPLCLACSLTGEAPVTGFYDVRNEGGHPQNVGVSRRGNLRIRYNNDYFQLDSVTAYLDETFLSLNDLDGTSLNLFTVGSQPGGKTYSEDVVLTSPEGHMLTGLVGFSLVRDKGFQTSFYSGALFPVSPISVEKVNTTSISGFAEATLKPIDRLSITVGGRYSHDKRDLDVQLNQENNLAFGGIPGLLAFSQQFSFSSFTPRFVVAYDLGNLNLYASYNKGFKAGGVSVPVSAPTNSVNPEKIDSYEVGAKFRSDDGRFYANLAGFHYKQKDLQVRVVDLSTGGGVTRNAASASGDGTELEVGFTPQQAVNLFAGVSLLWAKYDSFAGASVNSVVNGAFIPTFEDLSGARLANAPRFTGFVGADSQSHLYGGWLLELNAVVHYTSSYDFFPGAGGNLRLDRQGAFPLANLSALVGPSNKRYQIGLYVDNLLDREYLVNRQTSAPFGENDDVAAPRTYGLRLKYNFD